MPKEIGLIKDPTELIKLLKQAEKGVPNDASRCNCSLKRCSGWDSVSESAWPLEIKGPLATLRDISIDEPTFEEFQPSGARFEASNALISIAHFPYNRCDVFQCNRCNQGVLRYTEYGGYYIDQRARRVRSEQVISDPQMGH